MKSGSFNAWPVRMATTVASRLIRPSARSRSVAASVVAEAGSQPMPSHPIAAFAAAIAGSDTSVAKPPVKRTARRAFFHDAGAPIRIAWRRPLGRRRVSRWRRNAPASAVRMTAISSRWRCRAAAPRRPCSPARRCSISKHSVCCATSMSSPPCRAAALPPRCTVFHAIPATWNACNARRPARIGRSGITSRSCGRWRRATSRWCKTRCCGLSCPDCARPCREAVSRTSSKRNTWPRRSSRHTVFASPISTRAGRICS